MPEPTPAKKRADKTAERRSAILSAALAEFSEKGFAAARTDDIARRAGVAKGTIYLHFETKEALFEGIIREAMLPMVAGLKGLDRAPGETSRAFAERLLLGASEIMSGPGRADVVRLLVTDGARFPALAEIYYKTVIVEGFAVLQELMREAAAAGELRTKDLEKYPQLLMAPLIMGSLWGILFGRLQRLDVEGMVKAHLDLLFT